MPLAGIIYLIYKHRKVKHVFGASIAMVIRTSILSVVVLAAVV